MDRINEYANNMFRFESINEAWINKCVEYIHFLFGDSIKEKCVLDYAFGRGNWSLAFLKAGAKFVVSIDASHDNTRRFRDYCSKNSIKNIEIITGNILECENINIPNADLIWLYGILHHIDNPSYFINKLMPYTNEDTLFYIYVYNKLSLRNFLVNSSRKILTYSSEEEFLLDIPYFTPEARRRARDDLTAPHIDWYKVEDLETLLQKVGLTAIRQDIDFYEFINGKPNEEFYPLQCLAKKSLFTQEQFKLYEPVSYKPEKKILENLFLLANDSIIKVKGNNKSLVFGLFNTYYSINSQSQQDIIINSFLYLSAIILTLQQEIPEWFQDYAILISQSIEDLPKRKNIQQNDYNIIVKFLLENKIRL